MNEGGRIGGNRGIGNVFFQGVPRLNLKLREVSKGDRGMGGREMVNERQSCGTCILLPTPPPTIVFAPLSLREARPQPITFKVCYLSILARVLHGIGLNSVHSDCFVQRIVPG